ncbi:cation-transporting P-type ATPase [bacterium]|nr:MAG: cation-transporting P-type ATPase [bacterium]QQR62254.1 MAG: cation-transporting P-type ATPase [bacterium]QQR63182.1 MAG: cation-transporting P-type ATPase [bacterium]
MFYDFDKDKIISKFTFLYSLPISELYVIFGSSECKGLTNSQVENNRKKYGENVYKRVHDKSFYTLFLEQSGRPINFFIIIGIIIILIVTRDAHAATVLFSMLIIHTIIAAIFDWYNQALLEKLEQLSPFYVMVLRNKERHVIKEQELVVGDIIYISAGQRIAADIRIISTDGITVNEELFTKSDSAINKNNKLVSHTEEFSDYTNCLFAGTVVVNGNATGIVIHVGSETQLHKDDLYRTIDKIPVPLKRNLANYCYWLNGFIFALCVMILCLYKVTLNMSFEDALPLMIAIFFSITVDFFQILLIFILIANIERITSRHILIKQLDILEKLSAIDIVMTNKDGILTYNQKMVSVLYAQNIKWNPTGFGFNPEGTVKPFDQFCSTKCLEKLGLVSILMNRSAVAHNTDAHSLVLGNEVEIALAVFAQKLNITLEKANEEYQLLFDAPSDQSTPYHAALYVSKASYEIFVVGAPDVLIRQNDTIQRTNYIDLLNQGYEVVVVGCTTVDLKKEDFDLLTFEEKKQFLKTHIESGIQILGICGIYDIVRRDTYWSLENIYHLGMKFIMITNDSTRAVKTVAHRLGLLGQKTECVDGFTLELVPEQKLSALVDKTTLYSMMRADQKAHIVKLLQEKGFTVAMIGNKPEDIPAMDQADVSLVSNSYSFYDVRKHADIIILNNSFATFIEIIYQARHLFYTLRRAIRYFLSVNTVTVFLVIINIWLNFLHRGIVPFPLNIAQLLWVNLFVDTVLTLSIAFEKPDTELVAQPWSEKYILDTSSFFQSIAKGFWIASFCSIVFYLYYQDNVLYARSMVTALLGLFHLIDSWSCRSERVQAKKIGFFSSKWYLILVSIALFMYILPFSTRRMNSLFETAPLELYDFSVTVLLATTILLFEEIRKWWKYTFLHKFKLTNW